MAATTQSITRRLTLLSSRQDTARKSVTASPLAIVSGWLFGGRIPKQ